MPVESIQKVESKEVELDAQGKFYQIFNTLNDDLKYPNNSYTDEKNQEITLYTDYDKLVSDSPEIVIQKETTDIDWQSSISKYILTKYPDKFTLQTYATIEDGNLDQKQYVSDLTEDELKNDVLPNFERRINELQEYKAKERQNAIKSASEFAQVQNEAEHQQASAEVDALMNEFLA